MVLFVVMGHRNMFIQTLVSIGPPKIWFARLDFRSNWEITMDVYFQSSAVRSVVSFRVCEVWMWTDSSLCTIYITSILVHYCNLQLWKTALIPQAAKLCICFGHREKTVWKNQCQILGKRIFIFLLVRKSLLDVWCVKYCTVMSKSLQHSKSTSRIL